VATGRSGAGQPRRRRLTGVDLGGLVACAVVTALFFVFGVMPLLQRKHAFARQADRLADFRRKAAGLEATAAGLKRRLATARKALEETPLTVSRAAYHVNRRIAQLADLAAETGLTINEIQPGEPSSSLRFETVPVRLCAAGSYPTCVRFLRRLVERFPDTTVDSFKVMSNPKKPEQPAEFRVNLLWYAAAKSKPWKK